MAILSRRLFLVRTAAVAAGLTIIPRHVLGRGHTPPSDRFGLGFIGTGKQARGLLNAFRKHPVRILAGAEVDLRKLALFASLAEKAFVEQGGVAGLGGFRGHGDYREMLADPAIDGVIIATPDHWHAMQGIAAARAGKHIYCEKPLTRTVTEGRALVEAARRHGVVLQTGSMQRSWKNFRHACALVRNGYLGKVKEVLVSVGDPAIACDLGEEVLPAGLDWEGWIGPASYRPFHAELSPPVEKDIFPNWRKYQEYAGGILSDWGAHMFDIAQWGLGTDHTGPVTLIPPDDPTAVRGLTMEYEDGVVLRHADFGRGFGVRFIGEKGRIDVARGYLDSDPAPLVGATLQPGEQQLRVSDDHYADWLGAARKGGEPICPAAIGHRTNTISAIANIAYRLRRTLRWHPGRERFRGDQEADALLGPAYRAGWTWAEGRG